MEKIKKEHKRFKLRACFVAFISMLFMCFTIFFTPNFVADNISPDGILEQSTIIDINLIRFGFSILSTIGLLISALYIFRPNLVYSLQLKILKIPLFIKLLISKGPDGEIRESLMERKAEKNSRYFDLHINFSKRVITRSLILIIFLLNIGNVFAVWLEHNVNQTFLFKFFIEIFRVTGEGKLSTWYSACALLFCALLLTVITFLKRKDRDPYYWHWVGLATLFALMSLDEATAIHEMIGRFLRGTFHTTGIFYHAWVIPGIAFVLIFGILYLKFTLNLQKRTKYLFMVAFLIYLGGVLGLDMVGGAYIYKYKFTLTYSILTTIEEVFEMSGIVIFIYALLDYIEVCLRSKEVRLRFVK
jgi:hypothetical protein